MYELLRLELRLGLESRLGVGLEWVGEDLSRAGLGLGVLSRAWMGGGTRLRAGGRGGLG